ncbi:MAG: tyrosine--tRNA ligase [Candidatus Diapherotrites archaeon]|nr:tyrosine--tRNA ligase [Candidatus Diapherotrites archaeon]
MDIEKRIALIKEVGEEIITENELRELLERKKKITAYDGFEPSGKIHIAQGILRAININKMIKAGCEFIMFVADWHAWLNKKLGGKLENIRIAGEYMIETWKACGLKDVKYVWGSEIIKDEKYWEIVMKVAINSTLRRVVRCSQIMGRKESEIMSASQIIYPCMQAADIFYLNVDIAQLGMDQRKVNMLAREIAPKIGFDKPVAVHHHMLLGLTQVKSKAKGIERKIELKMSKSKPNSAIFMTDSKEEVEKKILAAYCPARQIAENPILEYAKYIIFESFKEMKIERKPKFGGDVVYKSYSELEKDFAKGELHPLDLKNATARYINKLLEPVRKHFERNTKAREILEQINKMQITR